MGLGLLGNFMGGAGIGASGEGLRQNQEAMKAEAQEKQRKQAFYDQKELAQFTNQLGWDRDKDMAGINFKNSQQLDAARFAHEDKKQGKDHEFQAGQQTARFVFEGDQKNKDRALEGKRISLLELAQNRKDWKQTLYERAADGDARSAQILNMMTPATADRDNWVMAQDGRVRTNKYTGQTFVMEGSGETAYWHEVGSGKQPKDSVPKQVAPTPTVPAVNYKGKGWW